MTRVRAAAWVACGWVACASVAADATGTDPTGLDAARDLAADGAAARAAGVPILLAVTREDCRYCEKLKRYVLVPMLRSGEYDDKVVMRELVIEPSSRVRHFDGRPAESAEVAESLDATLSPTVLLLDPDGRPLEPPILGINDVEFYGYYLDEAIGRARAALRQAPDKRKADDGT
jgi:hypothetical protein